MSDSDAVLFANEAYYRAFSDRDAAAMESVWASRDRVTCIHPGWAPLFGHDAVMESWAAILANEDSPTVGCRDAHAMVDGGMAVVICYEDLLDQYLIATNVFVKEGQVWRMIHHQAGPTNGQPAPEEPLTSGAVH